MIKKLVSVMEEQDKVLKTNRNLRYAEIDIEAERKAGRIAPDELYVPQHVIDANIRREQSVYVGYLTAPPRSLVLSNIQNPSTVTEPIERDITNRIRYDGWQMPLYRAVDSMQQNGYGVVEIVQDQSKPGHLVIQDVAYDDFGYCLDSKDIQSAEMITRQYHFTKTQLIALTKIKDPTKRFDIEQVERIVTAKDREAEDYKETSLFKVEKVMFRKKGVVQVGWSCQLKCDDWLRAPRPLYIGRQRRSPIGFWMKDFETDYPFFILPYTITENTTIRQFRGRAYFDQDVQEAISSLMSSVVTGYRRSTYFMFSKDIDNDPNGDVATQTVVVGNGKVVNSKVRQFMLAAPDATSLSAIQALTSANLQEQSQINYAANNRQDSRKTATEIQAAQQNSQQLSTIQLALFSTSIKAIYSTFFEVCRSRVLAQLILDLPPQLVELYGATYSIRPAGDSDVVERQQKIQQMQQAWPVMEHTPAAQMFLSKLLMLLFPEDAPQYLTAFQVDQTKDKALQSCLQVLGALVQDPNALSPQERQNVPQILGLIQNIIQILHPQQQPGQGKGQQQGSGKGIGGQPAIGANSPMQPQGGNRPQMPQGGSGGGPSPSMGQLLSTRLLQMARPAQQLQQQNP